MIWIELRFGLKWFVIWGVITDLVCDFNWFAYKFIFFCLKICDLAPRFDLRLMSPSLHNEIKVTNRNTHWKCSDWIILVMWLTLYKQHHSRHSLESTRHIHNVAHSVPHYMYMLHTRTCRSSCTYDCWFPVNQSQQISSPHYKSLCLSVE